MNHNSIQVYTKEIPNIKWELNQAVALPGKYEIHCWKASVYQLIHFRNQFFNLLSENEKERAKKFISEKSSDTYILAHGFLRFLLSRYISTPPPSIEFSLGVNGKPFLSLKNLHFNLSHSKEEIVIAVCHFIIGCDIEEINPGKDVRLIIKDFFSPEEKLRLESSSSEYEHFLKLWTSKEAFLKATGIGILTELNQINLAFSANKIHISPQDRQFFEYDKYYIITGYTGNNSILSLSSSISLEDVRFLEISDTFLQEELM